MLFDKTATVYTLSRNANMVSAWNSSATITCNIQPMGDQNGFSGSGVYNQFKMYTETMTVKEGDKVVEGGNTYIVKSADPWRGTLRQYLAVIMETSRGS